MQMKLSQVNIYRHVLETQRSFCKYTIRERGYCDVLLLQDSSQIELLKELMDLQKDMVVMLLSMLEGKFTLLID